MTNIRPIIEGQKTANLISLSAAGLIAKQLDNKLNVNYGVSWIRAIPYNKPALIPVVSFVGSLIRNLDDRTRGLLKDQLPETLETPPNIQTSLEEIGPNTQGAVKEAEVKGKEYAKKILDDIQKIGEKSYREITDYITGMVQQLESEPTARAIFINRLYTENTKKYFLGPSVEGKISDLVDQNKVLELKNKLAEITEQEKLQRLVDQVFIKSANNGNKSLETLQFISFPGAVTHGVEPSKTARLKAISESAKLASKTPEEHDKTQDFLKRTQTSLLKSKEEN